MSLSATQDGGFIVITSEGENSTIQVYQLLKLEEENPVLSGPISITSRDFAGKKLTGIDAIWIQGNNRVYTVSGTRQHQSSGFLLNCFSLDNKGSLTSLSELFINHEESSAYHKNIVGAANHIFISCESELVNINVNLSNNQLTLNNQMTLDDPGLYPSSLTYDQVLHNIYLTYSSASDYKPGDNTVFQVYMVSPDGSISRIRAISSPEKKSFYTEHALLPLNLFLIYIGSSDGGVFYTIDTSKTLPQNNAGVSQTRLSNFLLGRNANRLFYISRPNGNNQNNQLGAIRVNEKGNTEFIPESLVNVTAGYQKLILLPDGCKLLALVSGSNNNRNGSLVLYRINDPEAGCSPAPNETLIIAVASTGLGLFSIVVVTGLITTFLCRWLRKYGAQKGYTPIGSSDY